MNINQYFKVLWSNHCTVKPAYSAIIGTAEIRHYNRDDTRAGKKSIKSSPNNPKPGHQHQIKKFAPRRMDTSPSLIEEV